MHPKIRKLWNYDLFTENTQNSDQKFKNLNPQKRERRKKATARCFTKVKVRGGSRTAATPKMEHFVIIVNGWKPLTIIINSSILDVAAVLDPPLTVIIYLINLYKGDYGINLIKPIKTSTKETIPEKHWDYFNKYQIKISV